MSSTNQWIDVTRPIIPGMPVWPGDAEVEMEVACSVAAGGAANVSRWCFSSHTGTHVDPPYHFEPDGASVEAMSLTALCGECTVVSVDGDGHVTPAGLAPAAGARRVLIRTRNSLADRSVFHESYAALTLAAAEWLLAEGVLLVGVDGPSVEAFESETFEVHHALLRAGVAIVEGLDLRAVAAGRYEMVCAPLPLQGADGAPARVLLRPMP